MAASEVEELRERNQQLELTIRSLEIQLRHIYDPVEKKLCTRDVGVQVRKKAGKLAQRRKDAQQSQFDQEKEFLRNTGQTLSKKP